MFAFRKTIPRLRSNSNIDRWRNNNENKVLSKKNERNAILIRRITNNRRTTRHILKSSPSQKLDSKKRIWKNYRIK